MKKIKTDLLIIGAGLTGLTLNYLLKKESISIAVVEARKRFGGRILTEIEEGFAPIELGATWFGSKHTRLTRLLEELGLGSFPQVLGEKAIYEPISTSPFQLVSLPANDEPSFRIKGGTASLTTKLSQYLSEGDLHLDTIVKSISSSEDGLLVQTSKGLFSARRVVSTLPPYLFRQSIDLEGSISEELLKTMQATHTWMGESIKVALHFAAAFWRERGKSGTIFSNVGPINEFYDHSNFEDNTYALKGFLNGAYHSVTRKDRKDIVLSQLRKYYGEAINHHTEYTEKVWMKEAFTYLPYSEYMLPHQNNGHPLYREPYLDGRLFIAGAETAAEFPGYMEGAVRSAEWVYGQLSNAPS